MSSKTSQGNYARSGIGGSDYMEEDAHVCISDMLAWSKMAGAATAVTRM
jgi:hypothetical protein